jgi:hypothetical protein
MSKKNHRQSGEGFLLSAASKKTTEVLRHIKKRPRNATLSCLCDEVVIRVMSAGDSGEEVLLAFSINIILKKHTNLGDGHDGPPLVPLSSWCRAIVSGSDCPVVIYGGVGDGD